jgi:hypothetical protein
MVFTPLRHHCSPGFDRREAWLKVERDLERLRGRKTKPLSGGPLDRGVHEPPRSGARRTRSVFG